MTPTRQRPNTIREVLERYPSLTAHLICESLGYLTPTAAANAILNHIRGSAFYCEWYCHQAGGGRTLLQVGRDNLDNAFRRRKHHRGPMAHYPRARALVEAEIRGALPPGFSSWQ